jgi:hypothetical protein
MMERFISYENRDVEAKSGTYLARTTTLHVHSSRVFLQPICSRVHTMNLEAQKQLASAEYWDNKYTKDAEGHATPDRKEHERFQTFEQLRPFLEKQLPSVSESPRILQLGCGKSVSDRM